MAQRGCATYVLFYIFTACFLAYMVSSAILLGTGLIAWDVDHLDTSCVIGDVYDILNASSSGPKYNARIRVRQDGGLLYAKAILGDGASDDDAMALIRSEATTLANWTSLVTGGNLTMTGPASELLVWVYPSNEMASSGLPSFSVSGTLPDAALGEGVNASDIEYQKTGTDYCNVPGAEDNVWYETKSWFPVAVLRMAQAGIINAPLVIGIVCIMISVFAERCDERLTAIVTFWCWVSLILPLTAFFAVGGIGAAKWRQGSTDSSWEQYIAENSPQMELAYFIALVCYVGFNIFAFMITPSLYLQSWLALATVLRDFGLIEYRQCGKYEVPVPCPCPCPCPCSATAGQYYSTL